MIKPVQYRNAWLLKPIKTYESLMELEETDNLEDVTTYQITWLSEGQSLDDAKRKTDDLIERWGFFREVGELLFPDKFMFHREEMLEKLKELTNDK